MWYKNGQKVEKTVTPGEDTVGIEAKKDGTLRITMFPTAEGKYQCKAKNEFGVSTSNFTEIDMACECSFSDYIAF